MPPIEELLPHGIIKSTVRLLSQRHKLDEEVTSRVLLAVTLACAEALPRFEVNRGSADAFFRRVAWKAGVEFLGSKR